MKKFVAMALMVVMMVTMGCTAFAVYDEETEMIDYEFISCLAALGLKPDIKLDDSGMIWSRTCTIAELAKTAEELDGESEFVGDGMVYMWYSVEDNIGTFTITGSFTYDYGDEEANYQYYQAIFECDEFGDMEMVTESFDELIW